MGIFRQIPPTAGLPVYARDLGAFFDPALRQGSLEEDFKRYLGVGYAAVTYSGTAALYLILETLKEVSSKKTVIIPSYICPLVPLAIQRAGLKAEVCDIKEGSFDLDPAALEDICVTNKDILAVIPAHLAGIPVDFDTIEHIAKQYGIITIEDCAQSLGALYKGKRVGTLGDFAFFSLCRGKGLTLYEGGVAVAKDAGHARLLDNKITQLVKGDFFSEALKVFELFGYWMFYRPQLFWFVFGLPALFWNLQGRQLKAAIEDFSVDFPIHKVSRFRKSAGRAGFRRLENEIGSQRHKAHQYMQGLKGIGRVRVIEGSKNATATYPYLALLFKDQKDKKRFLENPRNTGLGVSCIYRLAITGYDYLKGVVPNRECPAARDFAERHVTLSTSTFVRPEDLAAVIEGLAKNT